MTHSRKEIQEIIHSAIVLEKTNLFRANELIKVARILHPGSPFIKAKLKDYEIRLSTEPWQKNRAGAQISEEHKILFIHIPKCGGTSINNSSLFSKPRGGHNSYKQIKMLLTNRDFYSYKAFTIVRNPWDRLASAFYYLNRSNKQTDIAVKVDYLECYGGKLNLFLEAFCEKPNDFLHLNLFKPMNYFINPNDSEIPLFVQKLEELDDITNLCNFIGLKISLDKLNKAPCKPDRKLHSSFTTQTFEGISAIFKEDIEIFKYTNYKLDDLKY